MYFIPIFRNEGKWSILNSKEQKRKYKRLNSDTRTLRRIGPQPKAFDLVGQFSILILFQNLTNLTITHIAPQLYIVYVAIKI